MNLNSSGEKQKRTGLLVKLTGIAALFVLLSLSVFSVISIRSVHTASLNTAVIMGKIKLDGDLVHFENMLLKEYGQLNLVNGVLTGQNGESLNYQYEFVDSLSKDLGIAVTIFIKENDDFRRISTSIVDDSGKRAVDTYLGSGSAAYPAIQSGSEYEGSAVILGDDYLTKYKPVFSPSGKDVIGILFVGIEMTTIGKVIISNNTGQVVMIIAIALVILLLSVFVNAFGISAILLKPLRSAIKMLREISEGEGDLTRKLTVSSRDEIADLARYFNQTLDKIKNLVIIIKKETAVLSEIGGKLADDMSKTAQAMNDITGTVQSIKGRMQSQSESVSETHATMEQVTGNINKLDGHIGNQSANIAQASSAIEQMVANIGSVTGTLVKNSENVKNLMKASEVSRNGLHEVAADIQEIARESEGLLDINSVMQSLASQTNLLSMNAAIEAAHAGEAGRGFAVVAGEVRKLAESSGQQSKTVAAVLKKIKESIDKISRSTAEVLKMFEAIESSVKTVAEQEEGIRAVMEEQGTGSRQILEGVGNVNEITRQVKGDSGEMLAGARGVISESEKLESATQEMTSNVNEMSSGAENINAAVNHVNELSGKNRSAIDVLIRELSRFKVE
ncbi:MAG: methyl-accepting chemotaxis protein [Treponema sp.]|nr:methyl-accepting chemotaxis protein [Treponema sp.]